MKKLIPGVNTQLEFHPAQINLFLNTRDYFSSNELYHLCCKVTGYRIKRQYLGNLIDKMVRRRLIERTGAKGIYKVL